MARHSEAFRFALLAFGFAGCTVVTKVDWTLIPQPEASAGSASAAGARDQLTEGGAPTVEGGAPTVEGGAPGEAESSGAGGS